MHKPENFEESIMFALGSVSEQRQSSEAVCEVMWATGRVDDAVYPQQKIGLRIMRDGKEIVPTGSMKLDTTADGILVAIHFTVGDAVASSAERSLPA
jgi:hypothetical protein